jgi:inner membrane protein
MDAVTHVAAGVAIARVIPTPSRKWAVWAGVALALLPDIDFLLVFLDRLTFIQHHRGFTHSLMALPLLALLVAGLGRCLGGPRWFRPLFLLSLAVLASHLLLDVATSYGTQILSPFSRRKFTLDWLFIIDPCLTLILLAGALAFLFASARGRRLAAVSLGLAGAYILLCGLYHHQALALARQAFMGKGPGDMRVAALPQPFSPRRWHLLGVGSETVKQAMINLPALAFLGAGGEARASETAWSPGLNPHAPSYAYDPPECLAVRTWCVHSLPVQINFPETEKILGTFFGFARFPLLVSRESKNGILVLKWVDLRFTIPGRAFPFALELHLEPDGRLRHWRLSRCGSLKR